MKKGITKKQIRSIYLPENYWKELDEIAKKEDTSASRIVKRITSAWLLGILVETKDKIESPMPVPGLRQRPAQK